MPPITRDVARRHPNSLNQHRKRGLPGIDYKWYTMGSEWRHPDFQKYREKLERDEREAEKKGKDALQHA
jgi:hypothetical protein